jgi:hypothetical protein
MPIEKPIKIIRKAVQRDAEALAKNEFLRKPEPRHFEDVFTTYKMLRMLEPKRLEISLIISAKYQDIKNEMGDELFELFDLAWINATREGRSELDFATEQLVRTNELPLNELNIELGKLDERYLTSKIEQIKKDPLIVKAFSGKEDILKKSNNIIFSLMLNLMKYNREESKFF